MGHPVVGKEISAVIKAIQEQKPYERTDCPECGYKLEKKDEVLHCRFCGWVSDFLSLSGGEW